MSQNPNVHHKVRTCVLCSGVLWVVSFYCCMYSILRLFIVVTVSYAALSARSLLKRRLLISVRLFLLFFFFYWSNKRTGLDEWCRTFFASPLSVLDFTMCWQKKSLWLKINGDCIRTFVFSINLHFFPVESLRENIFWPPPITNEDKSLWTFYRDMFLFSAWIVSELKIWTNAFYFVFSALQTLTFSSVIFKSDNVPGQALLIPYHRRSPSPYAESR